MDRLLRKFETARALVPAPVRRNARRRTRMGAIYFGSTSAPMGEALEALAKQGVHLDALRVRAFPFADAVYDFIAEHETVFVIEQNRDAQLKNLIVNEGGIDPRRLTSILHYEGAPITARFITAEILSHVRAELAAIREPAQ
jgi:2-oxoglutarate ferredoxin oxidoreductase subunit alpha